MTLVITPTEVPDVVLIDPRVFRDPRGYFLETFHGQKYARHGIESRFVQDNHSHSSRGILRGLHYQLQHPQEKLIYVVSGEIFDVAVDIRRGSPTFGKWAGALLSRENKRQIYIPGGFAHGFCVLSETADVIYKCSDFYNPGDEYGIRWNDPDIGIDWRLTGEPLLSDKDQKFLNLKDTPVGQLPVYEG